MRGGDTAQFELAVGDFAAFSGEQEQARTRIRNAIDAFSGNGLRRDAGRATILGTKTFGSLDGLKVINGRGEIVTYRGRRAVHLVAAPDHREDGR